jgi:hypothetical protein
LEEYNILSISMRVNPYRFFLHDGIFFIMYEWSLTMRVEECRGVRIHSDCEYTLIGRLGILKIN